MKHKIIHAACTHSQQINTLLHHMTQICHSEHIKDALASFQWLHITQRIQFKVAILTYQALDNSAPVYLSSYLTCVNDVQIVHSRLRL